MKLYYAETFNPRKACAVAKHLNSPVTFVRIDLTKGEHRHPDFLAINPNGRVPALLDDGKALWESDAIMCHLARAAHSQLWPDDDRQIEVMRWLSWNGQHFSRHTGTLYFEYLIKPKFGMGNPDAAAIGEATKFFRRSARVLNDHLRGRNTLVGDALTVADFAVATGFPYATEAHIPLDEFPEIKRWYQRLEDLPAWRDPYPQQAAA
ncbi:glutathione S-transferase family protein [Bradyrhizobium prioriisuperbiae]|uniref:glutathione S-transferase family protein n=1 Tax=Bradyrhizobium prioriisuperbiae TaxID=2854389 RepID=UPI0028EF6798|nr:glutathione S-transferase family protein [Bradyrhizobium prioritasuperba]